MPNLILRFTQKHLSLIVLVALTIAVATLSLAFFLGQSIRFDEAETLWAGTKHLGAILNFSAQNFQSPLYLIFLHAWELIFGSNIVFARMLSLIFFIVGIWVIYLLGRESYQRSLGLFAAALFAISPFMNWYAAEARMYSLFALLAICNQYFFVKAVRRAPHTSTGILAGYLVTAIAGIYTHYFFLLGLAAQAVFVLVSRRQLQASLVIRLLAMAGIAAVSFLPWLIFMISIGNPASVAASQAATSATVFNTFSDFLFGFNNDHLNTIIISFWPLTVLLAFLALRQNRMPSSITLFFVASVGLPMLGAFLISSFLEPLFISRYLILTLPSLYLLLAWVLFSYPKKLGRIFQTALLCLMAVFLIEEATSASVPVKENYRQASDYLSQHAGPNDVIALSSPYTIFPFEYYYHGPAVVVTIPSWNLVAQNQPDPFSDPALKTQADQLKTNYEGLWLLLSQDQGQQTAITQYFDTHFAKIYQHQFSPTLTLSFYKLNYKND